mmetsp:Transcript_5891/g.19151  ORF Transcript_5891/g.19151 Transcript_5891/m.19151 type:complete len:370 (-) Transcript_5891:76-1185(-)
MNQQQRRLGVAVEEVGPGLVGSVDVCEAGTRGGGGDAVRPVEEAFERIVFSFFLGGLGGPSRCAAEAHLFEHVGDVGVVAVHVEERGALGRRHREDDCLGDGGSGAVDLELDLRDDGWREACPGPPVLPGEVPPSFFDEGRHRLDLEDGARVCVENEAVRRRRYRDVSLGARLRSPSESFADVLDGVVRRRRRPGARELAEARRAGDAEARLGDELLLRAPEMPHRGEHADGLLVLPPGEPRRHRAPLPRRRQWWLLVVGEIVNVVEASDDVVSSDLGFEGAQTQRRRDGAPGDSSLTKQPPLRRVLPKKRSPTQRTRAPLRGGSVGQRQERPMRPDRRHRHSAPADVRHQSSLLLLLLSDMRVFVQQH